MDLQLGRAARNCTRVPSAEVQRAIPEPALTTTSKARPATPAQSTRAGLASPKGSAAQEARQVRRAAQPSEEEAEPKQDSRKKKKRAKRSDDRREGRLCRSLARQEVACSSPQRQTEVGSAWAEEALPVFGAGIISQSQQRRLDKAGTRLQAVSTGQRQPAAQAKEERRSSRSRSVTPVGFAAEEEEADESDDAVENAAIASALASTAETFAQLSKKEKIRAERSANSSIAKNKVACRMRRAALVFSSRAGVKLEGKENEDDQ